MVELVRKESNVHGYRYCRKEIRTRHESGREHEHTITIILMDFRLKKGVRYPYNIYIFRVIYKPNGGLASGVRWCALCSP